MSNKPNLILALASSYTPRGIQGYTNTVTNTRDQRKVNSFYEPVQNSMSGKRTVYLSKRYGTAVNQNFGTSGQVAYLIHLGAGRFGTDSTDNWVFSTSGSDSRASSSSTTTVILTAANYYPAFVDRTAISGTDNIVVQLANVSTEDQRVFYSTAIGSFTEITDSEFAGLTHVGKMEFMDGYAFVADRATGRIYNSDLNSLANWSANSYITKQIRQDQVQGLARLGKRIVCFGIQSAEVLANAGNATGSPLVTIPDLEVGIGIRESFVSGSAGYTHYYAVVDEKMYFVGREGLSGAGLYMFDGARFHKVSAGPFDKIISESWHGVSLYSVNKIVFSGKRGIALQLTATTAATQRWLMYFPDWNEWFEWNSTVITPVNSSGMRHLGVGSNQHNVYAFHHNQEVFTDAGTNYEWVHQFQLPNPSSSRRQFMDWCGLVGDTAASALNITVEFSDDDGATWFTAGTIDMTSAGKRLHRCGSWVGRRFVRLSYTGTLGLRLEQFIGHIH